MKKELSIQTQSILRIIAGSIFALITVYYLIQAITGNEAGIYVGWMLWLRLASMLFMAIGVFTGIATISIIGAVLFVVEAVAILGYVLVWSFLWTGDDWVQIIPLTLSGLAGVFLLLAIIFREPKESYTKIAPALPAICIFLYFLFLIFWGMGNPALVFKNIVGCIMLSVAFYIMALSQSFGMPEYLSGKKANTTITSNDKVNHESNIEKLSMLSQLLSDGVISREEFDEKKKQLLED